MKNVKLMSVVLSMAILAGSCGTMNNTTKGGIIGGGGGADHLNLRSGQGRL